MANKVKSQKILLSDLKPGSRGYVSALHVNGLLYRRLLDLGIVKGTRIKALFSGFSGDPVVYRFRDSHIAIRRRDARLVEVEPTPTSAGDVPEPLAPHSHEQCLGCRSRESGDFNPLDPYLVALAGNPNTGKSTVFNALTGLRQHVGNWPGKTVARAEGHWTYKHNLFNLVDLPGTYSLLSTSVEEEIARDFILFKSPDCTVVVADATCLERNLNLVLQIIQITPDAVVCVNLMDEARRKGIQIDTEKLSLALGVPVVGTAARSAEGLEELQEKVLDVASGRVETHPVVLRYDSKLESAVEELIEPVRKAFPQIPNPRWLAVRLLDGGDKRLLEEVKNGLPILTL